MSSCELQASSFELQASSFERDEPKGAGHGTCRFWCVLLIASVAGAHEIGTTRVTAEFHESRFDIGIVTDAVSLAEKIEGRPLAAGATELQLQSILEKGDAQFRRRAQASFDGVAAQAKITFAVQGTTATVRMAGDVPKDARNFMWNYGWTFASYALTVRNDSAHPVTQWLEGDQASTPFVLASAPPLATRAATALRYLTLGYTHILPNGLDHMLFVLGIYLLSGRARTVLAQVSAFTVAH